MRVISPLDLRRSLGAILDAASAGEQILVERDRRPLAMLVSVEDGRRLDPDAGEARARRLAALERLEALGRRLAAPQAPAPQAPAPQAPAPQAAPAAATRQAAPTARRPIVERSGPGLRPVDRYEAERRRHAAERDVVAGG